MTLKGRLDTDCVDAEIARLKRLWSGQRDDGAGVLAALLPPGALGEIDLFDRVQLAEAVRICQRSRSLAEAGRLLFAASRTRRSSANDADRLRKYLARFGLDWASTQLRWRTAAMTAFRTISIEHGRLLLGRKVAGAIPVHALKPPRYARGRRCAPRR